jgi:GntR family transcriptional regulator
MGRLLAGDQGRGLAMTRRAAPAVLSLLPYASLGTPGNPWEEQGLNVQVMASLATVNRVRIDHEADEFPYLQLARLLRERIESGEYAPGRAIPSVERIRQETGLATKTIRRAIGLLEDEGLVVVRPGWGTFVAGRG